MSVRCFLEGFEAGWSSDLSGRAREARYTNLPPGRYRFRVKAANAAGVWSAEASSGPVVIRRPPWTEWWFALLAGGAGAALLAGVIKAIVRWRYAEKLESEVAKRTAALRESESRYRQLFDDPSTAKLLVDPDGPRVVDANEQGRLLAKTPGPLVGRGLAEAGIAGLEEPVRWAAAGREGSFLVQAGHTPGGTRELEVRTSSIALAGRPYVLVTAQDVTARRRLEEERIKGSKLESLGVLAGGLAHDFNNLLMAVLSHVSLARQRAARGRDVEASLAAAETALMRASGLTAQLLTFAKGGAPVRRLTELGPLLRETAGFVLAGARSTCLFELPEVLWPAEVDGGQIGQLIGNILLNASQAMPAGGRVSIEAANLELEASHGLPLPPGPYVRISIADEGVGIPPELLDRIFDPYFTTKEGGQGLGLASCHSIVRRHGGHMRIDSTPGRGTTVTVWLPAAPGIRVEGEVEGRVTQRGQGRILAVDDELVVREAYGELLHELGYEPVVVPDGAEAVRRYAEAREEGRPFRAVLLDLTIRGGMGGKETLDELRRQDPAVRAIVASGYSSDPLLSSYREAGFDGMLSKPFGPELLSKVLREVLERPGP
jgi:signal transduction histidine kinase/CheY-like chemotaxis protein